MTINDRIPSVPQLPSALDGLHEMMRGEHPQPGLILDYDGTLTPTVPHPHDAILSDTMRVTLQRLARLCKVAIISGRDLGDIRQRVGIGSLWYVGNHGFDIAGPRGEHSEYWLGREHLPTLDGAQRDLTRNLARVPGCLVERRRFCISVHYRQVARHQIDQVRHAVDRTHAAYPELRLAQGRKVFELQPDIHWNRGKAVRWLMQMLDIAPPHCFPIYIGDDVADEAAFRALAAKGVGILVSRQPHASFATYGLKNPVEVERFLQHLANKLSGRALVEKSQ